jgi:hypothetical protein
MNEKTIQSVALEEIWKQNSDGYMPVLLEIYNPDIKWNDKSLAQEDMYLRVIDDSNPVVYKGKKYLSCRFEYTPPEEDGKKLGQASINISAIDSRVTQMLRSIELQCEVKVVAAFAKNGNVYKFLPIDYLTAKMPTATYDRITATLSLINKDVLSLNVPRDIATKNTLPSVDVDG